MDKYQEALNSLRNVSYDDYHSCMLEETHGDKLDIIEKALERAKKVEELLTLYREHYKLVPFTPGLGNKSKRVCDISNEIQALEKELGETK